MMNTPFKFRYVNEIVGTFVILVVALLVAGVLLAAHARDWFTPIHRYPVDFPAEGSLGIQAGATVEILGTAVGKVERIVVKDDGRMGAEIAIRGEFNRFVRSDSLALVKKRYAVAGEAFITITEGKGEPLAPGSSLAVTKDTELTEMLEELLEQVRTTTVPAIAQIRLTAEEFGKLATDLRNPQGPLQGLLTNLQSISAGLERGEGAAGALLRDPQTADDLKGILDKINAALDDLKRTTAQLPPMAAKIGGEVNDLPGIVLQTQETIRESEQLIEAIQRHWLIRGYVPQPEPPALIPATEVRSP